jgi:hypothetical protein
VNSIKIILLFSQVLLLLTGCRFDNAEEETSGGGLFNNHELVENGFLLSVPTSKTFIATENIDIVATHSYELTVTGTPQISVDIGGSSVKADYLTGDGTKNLTFRYTVAVSDEDADGISVTNSISLNGGSIKFTNNEVVTDAAVASIVAPSTAGIKVDAINPILNSVTPPTPKTYHLNQQVNYLAVFDEIVEVLGTPQVLIDIGGVTKAADYISGTGTTNLIFSYNVAPGDVDIDGITASPSITLNSGSIKDTAGNVPELTFVTVPTLTTFVDANSPVIQSLNLPSDKTYLLGEVVTLDIIFNEIVDINGGIPSVEFNIEGTIVDAKYFAGSGTNTLNFLYIVTQGLHDTNGLVVANSIELNGATIQDGSLADAILDLTPPLTPGILIDSRIPEVIIITAPIDNNYVTAQNLDFTFEFSEAVTVINTPRVEISLATGNVFADYLSGSGSTILIFRYTVTAPSMDNDGIVIDSLLDLNAGTIIGSNSINADLDISTAVSGVDTTGIFINAAAPSVVSITPPVDNNYLTGTNLDFTLVFSAVVNVTNNPRISIDVGGSTVYASYLSGSGSNSLLFRYIAAAPDNDVDGIALNSAIDLNATGIIQDAGLNNISLDLTAYIPTMTNVFVNKVSTVITTVTPPANTTYLETENLDFIINTDGVINVTGSPRLQIDVSGVTKYANYSSGTGSTALTFTYTVQAGEEDTNGIGFASSLIDLNTGALLNLAGDSLNLNLDASIALPNLSSILIDGAIPTVTITSALAITSANENNYSVSGTCSEEGRIVTTDIDGISLTPFCIGGTWTTGAVNVSALLDNPALPITADHIDLATNNATQATTTVDKDSATSQVAITYSPNITSANVTGYSVSGTCTDIGLTIDVFIGALNLQPNCSGGTWTTGFIDVTTVLDNAAVLITADHNGAIQATTNVSKDTLSSTVTIVSAPNISISNETSYISSGTCSVDATMVDIYIGALNFQPTCSSGSWTTGSIDVSSLTDGAVLVTADHSTATQATTNINKNTATPTVASLSVPTTLTNSCDLSWNLNDPGGFSIDDYEVNYKVKGSPTWLPFSDGVSTTTNATVTSLIASTIYEFRIRLQYDTSSYSDWSNTAEGETKPDNLLFSSPYAAMNVGGSTDTKVVALLDNTRIYLNGVEIAGSPIAKGVPTSLPTHARYDVIDADGPIFTAGRIGSGSNTAKGNIAWQPTSWAGKTFSFNATRESSQQLYVYATDDTFVEVKQGATVLDSATITAGNGVKLTWTTPLGSYQVISTGTILAFHVSGDGVSNITDPKPLLPSSNEIIGFPSSSMRITTNFDSTNYSLIHSNSVATSGNLSKISSIQINPQGTSSLYQGDSLIISADRNISGASYADTNGNCAAPFLPTNLMKTKYMINTASDWVAFSSKQAGTIDVYSPTQTIGVSTPVQIQLSRTGVNPNAPYSARLGTTAEGYRFVATVPVAGWYQPNNDGGSADEDETILYGSD